MASSSPETSNAAPETAAGGLLQLRLPDTTDFRELLNGRIDIIEYLTSAQENGSGRSTPLGGALSQPQQQPSTSATAGCSNEGGASATGETRVARARPQLMRGAAPAAQLDPAYRRYTAPAAGPMFGQPQRSLPESPPETDSGAGSAGSPSSASDNSPYSPDFHSFHPGHGNPSLLQTVIQPPMQQQQQQGGVILGVHGMDLGAGAPLLGHHDQPRSVVHHHAAATAAAGAHGLAAFGPPPPTPGPTQLSPAQQICSYGLPPYGAAPDAASLGHYNARKRMRSTNEYPVKPEPTSPRQTGGGGGGGGGGAASDDGIFDMETGYPHQPTIRFSEFQPETFHVITDATGRPLQKLGVHVVADKGFNLSQFDNGAFVNQKKNHFQISVHIEANDPMPAKFVRVENALKPIKEFSLDFYGVKSEMTSSMIGIKQSQQDRRPQGYEPVKMELPPSRVTRVTVHRLHFSETTMNNQRKNGRPNPDQKFFYLIVTLNALTPDGQLHPVCTYHSEKVIVRASNPGQFDSGDSEAHWQKGQGNQIYHPGPVSVGSDRMLGAALNVTGDIAYTGNLFHPSDQRLKQNIHEVDSSDALSRLAQIRIVSYELRPEVADEWGLTERERNRVGVIAQEVEQILPDAVDDNGEFLTVDDNRIFYESAAAVKELCRLTGNLEYKIDEVEKISKKLTRLSKLKRLGSMRSDLSSADGGGGGGGSSGICGSSQISCSRSSLGSVRSAPPGRPADKPLRPALRYDAGTRHRQQQRYCQHRCHRDPGLCSNKIIQATIVVLVVVMAFCLVSMCTLYVLDWIGQQNRAGRLDNRPSGGLVGASQRPPPGATNSSQRPPLGHMKDDQLGPAASPVPPLWKETPLWPTGAAPAALHPCTQMDCRQYCCPNKYGYVVGGRPIADGDLRVAVGADRLPSDAKSKAANQTVRKLRAKRHVELPIGSPEPETVANDGPMVGSLGVVHMELPSLNVSLGHTHCIGRACDDRNGGNFSLFVPVSPYLPHVPLQLRLFAEKGLVVQYCREREAHGDQCSDAARDLRRLDKPPADQRLSTQKAVIEEEDSTFELPVGDTMRSAYTFRVGFTRELCSARNEDAGKTFDEYTLIFYRVCRSYGP